MFTHWGYLTSWRNFGEKLVPKETLVDFWWVVLGGWAGQTGTECEGERGFWMEEGLVLCLVQKVGRSVTI